MDYFVDSLLESQINTLILRCSQPSGWLQGTPSIHVLCERMLGRWRVSKGKGR